MNLPDGGLLIVNEGILLEPRADDRLILWLPGERSKGYQFWERIGTSARPAVTVHEGVRSVEVTSVALQQRRTSRLVGLLRRMTRKMSSRSFTLPSGEVAEQSGARRTDRRLARSEDESVPLDEAKIKARWPEVRECRAIGPNLYLVGGIEADRNSPEMAMSTATDEKPLPSDAETSVTRAERLLEAARRAGDRPREATALVDLGMVWLEAGQLPRAATTLNEALGAARSVNDPVIEADASTSLATAELMLKQPRRAIPLLELALRHARATSGRFAEKRILEQLGLAHWILGDLVRGLDDLEQARGIAAELGDGPHEATLHWCAAVVHAELGRSDRAIEEAESAVALWRRLANPSGEWYAHHLARFRASKTGLALPERSAADADIRGSMNRTACAGSPGSSPTSTETGPGLLRMALTAGKAMKTFIGSGFKTVSAESYRGRLAVCEACEHHTGVRCRPCGCITVVKARLLHERCPVGRWPS